MAKKIKDDYLSERQKFARKLDRAPKTSITVNGAVGIIYSVNKITDAAENTFYKATILIDRTYIAGKADTKLESIVEALKHMELQGNLIQEYMK